MHNLTLKNVSKKFKNNEILSDVNINFSSGKVYGIIGPNGAGKSVLFKMICGLMSLDSGTIEFDNELLAKDTVKKVNFGISIEKPSFIENMTGYENLIFLSNIKNIIDKNVINEYLSYFDLDLKKDEIVKKYSLGMKQKLSIIQSLMESPDVILFDEITNSLDIEAKEKVYSLIKKEKSNKKIILYVNHNIEEIRMICDEVYKIENRKLILCEKF